MSKLKITLIVAWMLAVVCCFNSCDKGTGLRSEKKLKKQIQGNWERINFKSDINSEYWTFDNGIVSRVISDSTGTRLLDQGGYNIDGKLFGSDYLVITEFKKTVDELNAKWNLIELNDDVMIISTSETKGGGLFTIEFVKKK